MVTAHNTFQSMHPSELAGEIIKLRAVVEAHVDDPLTRMRALQVLGAASSQLGGIVGSCWEPRAVPNGELATAYLAWAAKRCHLERAQVLHAAAWRVLGGSQGGRRGAAHFQRPCRTDEELKTALDELQAIALGQMKFARR
jgi:hypothetical protein